MGKQGGGCQPALAESYPDLKSNQEFARLQEAVEKLEEVIADRRELYNSAVNINNTWPPNSRTC